MSASSTDRRQAPRPRVLRRGKIVLPGGHCVIGCIVLDLTARGARLKLGQWLPLPEAFELRIENGPSYQAELRFRSPELAGVRFRDAA